ncbi:hypothetical protein A3A79_04855 [Candidatus Gottesmanbacteria bacterium RIFCSPLOWO2_01_FULL_43_11b]|uniref:Glycosyltransferase RgtA/B/C/D-like domain-containing protein n=1 Tax=Candidatus Gottesmanbacteria bacterium RIFCSPLOWO2_01_FULL_43_11b TaxID=1798392 RepID=A0A1F6AIE9_9BACT|nr:MAG: hypothetical protein A3A79_04855 [Candidatus Gottesmanbacteria bacterium RIFCSPLOWO2_01_FULL_43_11b]
MKRLGFILGTLTALFYLAIQVASLSNYGVNWDEPTHFGRGHAILHFFLTGNKDYKQLTEKENIRRSFYQSDAYTFNVFEKKFAQAAPLTVGNHPPLSGFFAAIFNKIFYQKLAILGDIESYHLYSIVISSAFIGILFYFVHDVYGLFAAVVAAISLITHPLFLGESRFNIKDVPEASYFGITLVCFYYAMTKKNLKWLLATVIFFGLGLATKLNILFVLPIMLLWGVVAGIKKTKILSVLILVFFVGGIIFFASWPMLWASPVVRILKVLTYYKTIGTNTHFDPQYLTIFRLNSYALQWILYSTPLVTLFFSFLGFVQVVRNRSSFLVLLWFLTPIARVTLPNTNIYGGVRQIMEYIPPMAILSGIGAAAMVSWLKNKRGKLKTVFQMIIILSFVPITMKMIQMHPNESVYFNPIIGGLKGAAQRGIPGWGNSLGSTYRQGVGWLNAHAEKGAKIATVFGLRSNIPLIDLRPDIDFQNKYRSGIYRDGEYIIDVTHEGTQEHLYLRKYLDRFLVPVYELTVDSVPLLKIWKNDLEHTKPFYKSEERILWNVNSVVQDERKIDIDIGKVLQITQLTVFYNTRTFCALPAKGYVEYSVDNEHWLRAVNDLTSSPLSSWFKPQPEPGILQFLFAAEPVRFIRLFIHDETSCLLRGPVWVWVNYL